MREEFLITRQGKQYVLFAGLLDEAHQEGLRGIDTELVQVPTTENGNVAVVKATVEMEDGRTFSGIGDASPENVGRNIVPHIIRMAETRAKARALRDAVNVGVTALEELSDNEAPTPTRPPASPTQRQAAPRGAEPTPISRGRQSRSQDGEKASGGSQSKATPNQLNYLGKLVSESVHKSVGKFEEMVGKPMPELTREECSEWIGRLSGRTG